MSNDETVFREVDEAVAAERQHEFFRRNAALLIGGAAAIVLGVAGWQFWSAQTDARSQDAALRFSTAIETLEGSPEDGRAALEAMSEESHKGYSLLADMRRAGSLAAVDREGSLRLYRRIYDDGAAPRPLRELARLRAAALAFDDGRDAVLSDLGSLPESDSPFRYYAAELAALAALQAKDFQAAESMFEQAAADPDAPAPVRQRAAEFAAIAEAGKAGVNISGEARVDDLLRALGDLQPEKGAEAAPQGEEVPGAEQAGESDGVSPNVESATGEDQ